MGDEVPGGHRGRLPSASNDSAQEDNDDDPDSSSAASAPPSASGSSASRSRLPMAERDCRNLGRVDRPCSNTPQHSRNHSHNHRRDGTSSTPEARNTRHRDKSSATNGLGSANGSAVRNRSSGALSSREPQAAEPAVDAIPLPTMDVEDADESAVEHSVLTPIKLTDISTLFTVENIHSNVSTTHNWQATKSTIKERLGYMFGNELMADVFFIVGRGSQMQRVPAHKFVLSVSSAVFDAMFNGGMATSSTEVEIPDVEPPAFICLLRFLYTDEVRIGPETVMQCLYTAKKYAVVALERACVEFLKRNLRSDNAVMLLTQARLFDEPQLAALCLEMIDKTTSDALSAESFTDIDIDTLCTVLERDTLGIRECKLFAAVCRWAEAECHRQQLEVTSENQRQVLGARALELIRFPLMSIEEFAAGPAQSGLLSDRELVELFLHYTLTPRPPIKFSSISRRCMRGKEETVSRFGQVETRWGYSGTSDRIRFLVNRKIFIVGFGLYGSIQAPAEYSASIQIIKMDTGHTCASNETGFVSDGSKSAFRVTFKEPVEILPGATYTACATLKGPDSYYGTKGMPKVPHDPASGGGKLLFQFAYAAGNNNGTSVEDGQIPEIIFYT